MMRTAKGFAAAVMLSLAGMSAGAQVAAGPETGTDHAVPRRSFALVLGTSVESVHYWHGGEAMDSYAHAHPGRYIVFEQDGVLHRLEKEATVQQVEAAYAPMEALVARQRALAAEQKPLSEQQKALSAEMRGATTPVEMQRIGAVQGSLGRQQGEIGRRQGEIGRQQGALGRALNEKVQGLLDECLRNGSCPAVADSRTAG